MYKYLETFLGESTWALWESYKTNFRENYNGMLKLGANPYNFVNQISSLITGEDPNSGHLTIQQEALLHLEQMQIKDWRYIKEFYQSYYHFCAISGNGFNQELGEKLFRKLPGTLGRDEEHKCIIDNLWISFSQIFNHQTNKNLDRKYFITCLNCLSQYFHKKNNSNVNFSFYVIYQGHKTSIFKTWEEVLPYISNHPRPFFKGFYNLTHALDQCKINLGNNYFISPLVKQFLNHHGQPYLKPVEPCSSQTTTPDLTHDFPPLFPPLQNQDHLLREELEILRKKYDRSEQDYLIIKKLYEDKIENEIDIKLKNTALERKKFKIEHTNNFEHINNFSVLENQPEDIKI